MKQKNKAKVRKKTKSMNFINISAYKGIRYETKQNLDFI